MAVTQADVLDALRSVREPELRTGIMELDLVRAVEVHNGAVRVTVGIPAPVHPQGPELMRRVQQAVAALASVDRVDVDLVPLDDDEVEALAGRLQGLGVGPGLPVAGPDQPAGGPAAPSRIPFAEAGSPTRVLAITSGKGGVGKSSVTVNLAVSLAQRGLDVAVLDADVYGFSVPKMLGIDRAPLVIDRVVVPPVAHDVRCISIGFFVSDDQPVIWRGPMLHKALEQFLTDVYWGSPDFLLVDMPPGTGDVALSISQFIPRAEVFVVTTPQPAAQRVAQRSALMATKVNLTVAGVVENMSWFTADDGRRYELFGAGGGQSLADQLKVPLLGQVPLVPALREGGDVGMPITVSDPESDAARAFAGIAERIVVELAPKRIYRRELTIL